MKKKLFITIAIGVFMIAMVVNLSVAQMNKSGKLSMENISLMTQAVAEYNGHNCPGGTCRNTIVGCEVCCASGQKAVCDTWECRCDKA